MPSLYERTRVTRKNDRRVKLSAEDRADIIRLYKRGDWSHRDLASCFAVSKRLIGLVLNPERYEKMLTDRKKNKVHLKYYKKEKHKEYMRVHRAHKKEIFARDADKK